MQTIAVILNRFTMYRVVLYGLIVLLAVADTFAFMNVISIAPVGLLVSVGVLVASCYVANRFFAWLWHAPYNTESWLITALILACIMPQTGTAHKALLVALTGVIAMASKYILVVRGSHFFNPAAIAALVVTATALLPATWWIATPNLAPFTALLALVVLRKQRRFALFFAFAAAALAMMLYVGMLHDQSVWSIAKNAVLSWPILFFGSIMLTEPGTLPPTRYYQLLFGVLVGVVFSSELYAGNLASSPQTALIIGNIFTLLIAPPIGAMLRLKKITPIGPSQYDLAFDRPRHLNFSAGQYLEWTLPHAHTDSRGNRRIFSIASSPTDDEIHIGIKMYQPSSSFKKALLGLKPGKSIRVAHVAGSFTLPFESARPLVFIAGGIGITPFRSMLRYLAAKGEQRDVTLLYTANSEADFVYKHDLHETAAIGLTENYITGRLQEDQLRAQLDKLKQAHVYISGPDAFVTHCKNTLLALGVARTSIKTDHFTGY